MKKEPQITQAYSIITPTGEKIHVANRITFYHESGWEDYSIIKIMESWVEMLPKDTPLIKMTMREDGIHTLKDLFIARFIGELNLRLPGIEMSCEKIKENLDDMKNLIKSFKLED